MSFSYDPTLPTYLDKVRFYIGDTDSAAPIMSNEEITATLAMYGAVYLSAAAVAESIAAKYSRKITMSVDGLSVQYRELAANYRTLAQVLRSHGEDAGGLGVPIITGVSISEMDSVSKNTDRVPSQFKLGQFDNPPRTGGGPIGGGSDSDDTSNSQ